MIFVQNEMKMLPGHKGSLPLFHLPGQTTSFSQEIHFFAREEVQFSGRLEDHLLKQR